MYNFLCLHQVNVAFCYWAILLWANLIYKYVQVRAEMTTLISLKICLQILFSFWFQCMLDNIMQTLIQLQFERNYSNKSVFGFNENRVRLNRSWFVIHNEVLDFQDWIVCCYHEPFHDKITREKSLKLSMHLWRLHYIKVILTLWTMNYVDCVHFCCIDSFHIVRNRAN